MEATLSSRGKNTGVLAPDSLSQPTTPTPPMHPGGTAKMVLGPSTFMQVRRVSSTLQPTQADTPGEIWSS